MSGRQSLIFTNTLSTGQPVSEAKKAVPSVAAPVPTGEAGEQERTPFAAIGAAVQWLNPVPSSVSFGHVGSDGSTHTK
jgi:hypothetical protein